MHDLFFYVADPGAISIMLPIWDLAKSKGVKVGWIADGYAKSYFKDQGFEVISGIDNFIEGSTGGEEILFGSQVKKNRTASLLKEASKKGVRSYFLLDHWCNYEMHFSLGNERVYPSESILVMDKFAREEMVRLGVPSEKIMVVGHPAIEKTINIYKSFNGEPKINQILFLSEPIEQDCGYAKNGKPTLGYTQYSVIRFLLESIIANKMMKLKTNIIVKPHPREDARKLKDILREYENKLHISYDNRSKTTDLIVNSGCIFGITTILLLHSMAIGKRTGSIQVDRNAVGASASNPYLEDALVLDRESVTDVLNRKSGHSLRLPDNSAQRILDVLSR